LGVSEFQKFGEVAVRARGCPLGLGARKR